MTATTICQERLSEESRFKLWSALWRRLLTDPGDLHAETQRPEPSLTLIDVEDGGVG